MPLFRIIVLVAVMFQTTAQAQISFKRAGDYYALCKDSVVVTPYVYTEVSRFSEGRAWVNKGDLYGYIDTNLNDVTPYHFTDVSAFRNGFTVVSKDSFYGYIDAQGNERSAMTYLEALPVQHAFATTRDSSGWMILDTLFEPISGLRFDVPPFALSENFVVCANKGKWGVLNREGQLIHPMIYDLITAEGVGYIKNHKVYFGLF